MTAFRSTTIRCRHCRRPIEGCVGRHGDWMHVGDRQEHCLNGDHLAAPETADQMDAVHKGRERRVS